MKKENHDEIMKEIGRGPKVEEEKATINFRYGALSTSAQKAMEHVNVYNKL